MTTPRSANLDMGEIMLSFTFPKLVLLILGALFTVLFLKLLHQGYSTSKMEPPVVSHWIPWVGSARSYGRDPYKFFRENRRKYGDVFTFTLCGKKMTACLGTQGNDFILNASLQDLNAEEVYTHLTTPVFGFGVVYDCPNSVLMEQKKILRSGLSTEALQSHVPLFVNEFYAYIQTWSLKGAMDVNQVMEEITLYMASRALQGKEVRQALDSSFAKMFLDLDNGFTVSNFVMPWLPSAANKKRDRAQRKLTETYVKIIKARRELGQVEQGGEKDILWNLMSYKYNDGSSLPDDIMAHLMIAMAMAGQHTSASTGAWTLLRLASSPGVADELYQEQIRILGPSLGQSLTYEDVNRLSLHALVIKETLRLHAPIHSIMRAVKKPLSITINYKDTRTANTYIIPTSHVLLAAPGVTAQSSEYFPQPHIWNPHRWDRVAGIGEGDEKMDYGYGLVTKSTKSPYLPFGAGRHRCVGEQYAYLQVATILALMVREFKFKLMEGESTVPKTDYKALFTKPMDPARIQWERRRKTST